MLMNYTPIVVTPVPVNYRISGSSHISEPAQELHNSWAAPSVGGNITEIPEEGRKKNPNNHSG